MRILVFRLFPAMLLALLVGVSLLLAGCGTDSDNRTIPNQFTGDYAGELIAIPGGTIGAIRATIFPSGSVQFDVSTVDGFFFVTGGINTNNTLTATGLFNGEQIDFVGTWSANESGSASGTWINRTSNETGTWTIAQEGLSVAGAAGEYTGTYAMTGFTGAITFVVNADGSVTGSATGFGIADTTLTGSLTRNNMIVLTGSPDIGSTVFFTGTQNTTTFAITGTAGTSLDGGVAGTWTAAVAIGA